MSTQALEAVAVRDGPSGQGDLRRVYMTLGEAALLGLVGAVVYSMAAGGTWPHARGPWVARP